MARKKPDPVSAAGQRAFNSKAKSFTKKNAGKLLNSSPRKSKKATKADDDATAIVIGVVALTFAATAISSTVKAVKEKFTKDDSQSSR